MNYIVKTSLLVLLIATLFSPISVGQNQRKEIINELSAGSAGQGKVRVFEDDAIKGVLGSPMSAPRTVYSKGDEQYVKMRGFKIQAFAGNNQRTSKNEASYKQRIISEAFPEHETVIMFESPFWRLRVGNFRTREEANKVMQEMREVFTTFGKEMYVVVDEVKIPVH